MRSPRLVPMVLPLASLAIAGACSSGSAPSRPVGQPGSGSSSGAPGSTSGSGGSSGSGNSSSGSGGPDGGPAGSSSGSGSSGSGTGSSSGAAGSSTGGAASGSSSGAAPGDGGSQPGPATGCAGANLLAVPDDTSTAGPWPVGVKTLQLSMTGGMRPVEVWYPATLGSDAGKSVVNYDVTSWLPSGEAAKIPTDQNQLQPCNCYRDLPLDATHGPYPVVIFVHGTGSLRIGNLSAMTLWASRGFIAVATDHAGLYLGDFLSSVSLNACPSPTGVGYNVFTTAANQSADVDAMIAAITNKSGDFSFLGSSADMSRIGISGHSQGASDAASFAGKPHVQVDMPLADFGGTTASGPELKSVLVVGGMSDSVVAYSQDTSAYTGSRAAIKRLVGITGGEHLDVTDLCLTNGSGKNAIQVAQAAGVCGAGMLASLAKCGMIAQPIGPAITNYATTAAIEETLHCTNRDAAFSSLKTKFSGVGDYQHTP